MCVIMCCDEKTGWPTLDSLLDAEQMNGHGGGIAYIGKDGQIHYEKGISAKDIHAIISSGIKLPAVIHFRIATVGGVNPFLCHPFEITNQSALRKKGKCEAVLFHNGHWDEWQDRCFDALIAKNTKLPSGDFSDSRAMAWLASQYGTTIFNLIASKDNKVAILSKHGIQKFGEGWTKVKGVDCSNNHFTWAGQYGAYMGYDEDELYSDYGKTFSKKDSNFIKEHNKNNKVGGKMSLDEWREKYSSYYKGQKEADKISREDYEIIYEENCINDEIFDNYIKNRESVITDDIGPINEAKSYDRCAVP